MGFGNRLDHDGSNFINGLILQYVSNLTALGGSGNSEVLEEIGHGGGAFEGIS